MNEKQQQLLFDKGITNVPSDALCSDNALEESLGMVYDNGEHRVIQKPVEFITSSIDDYDDPSHPENITVKLLYIHRFNNEERYIVSVIVNQNTLVGWGIKDRDSLKLRGWIVDEKETSKHVLVYSEKMKITSVGKTLVISGEEGLFYHLWKDDYYLSVGSLPEPVVDFYLEGTCISKFDFHGIKWIAGQSESYYVRNSINVTELLDKGLMIDEQDTYNDTVVGLYSKNKKAISQKKLFCEPFLVRVAFELFDGSYTKISRPVLLFPSVTTNSYAFISNGNKKWLSLATFGCKLRYINKTKGLDSFSDIIKDIVVFVSDDINIYDLSVDQPEPTSDTATGIAYDCVCHVHNAPSSISNPNLSLYRYYNAEIYDGEIMYKILKQRDKNDISNDIKSTSIFYKLCAIDKTEGASRDIAEHIDTHILENITTQQTIESDDYYSRNPLKADYIYSYNNRLNLANVERGFFEGYDSFMPFEETTEHIYSIFVKIRTDVKEVWVKHESESTKQMQGCFFYYPDSRAKQVVIYKKTPSTSGLGECILNETLKEHIGLNGAFFFKGLPGIDFTQETNLSPQPSSPPSYNNDEKELLSNYIIQSEAGNPLLFKAAGYFNVGTGKIMAISSLTQAISEGQFGQYPLLVFSESGIWSMSVASTGYYSAIHPMSREICNNPISVTQTDGAVFFTTKKGMMVVVGNQVKCVSEQLTGKQDGFVTSSEIRDFDSFFKNCFIAYDYRDSMLWIFNKGVQTCLVYSIKNGTFGKASFKDISQVVNYYPDYLIQDTAHHIYSLFNRPNINNDKDPYTGTMISRPMKLENALALKSLIHVNHIHTLSDGATLTLRIFASNDLMHWVELTSLRGTPWLYYRFRYDFANMKAIDRFAGTMVVTQERRINKPRSVNFISSNYVYSITTSYSGDIVIPTNEQQQTVAISANFFRTLGSAEPQPVNCYWVVWSRSVDNVYTPLYTGNGDETDELQVTVNTSVSSVVIGMNVNRTPTVGDSQATKVLSVTKIADSQPTYTYSINVNPSIITVPEGTTITELVTFYAMRSIKGSNPEFYPAYMRVWRLYGGTYTMLDEAYTQELGILVDLTDSYGSLAVAICEKDWPDTSNYDSYEEIQVAQGEAPAPDPTPTPPPTPTPSGDDVAVTITLNNASQNTLTIENIIKFGFSNGERMDIRLSSTSPVYVQAGASKTFSATALNGKTFYGLTFASEAVCQQQDWNNNVFIYDLNHVSDNYGMDALSSTDKFEKNRTYNLKCNTSPAEQPQPTPGPSGGNPIITFNVNIINNTGSAVTLDGFMRFFVGNPDHNGVYCGWNGVYNSSERATFSPTAVTLAAGDSQIFSVTPVLGDTDGLGEKSPLSPDLLYAAERSRNVCVYVGGVSETVLCANMPTSIIFAEGGTYDVILGG